MIENVVKEEIKPKLRIAWPKLIGGGVLTLFAIGGGLFDIFNNWTFGMEKSLPIAGTFILAGFGLLALPAMAESKLDVRMWFLVAVCGALSLYAGYKNHMTSQRNHDLAQAAVTTRYEQAQKAIADAEADIRQAKAEIAGITEMMGSAELQQLYSDARDRAAKEGSEGRGGCKARCRAAEDEAKGFLPRIAMAKAKEDAQGRLDAAQARMGHEKASAPTAPKQAGESAQEETLMAVLLLLVTVVGATLFERGCRLLYGSWDWEAPKRSKVAAAKKQAEVAAHAVQIASAKGLPGFIALCKHGEPTPQKDVYAALVRWWQATGQKGDCPSARALGLALGKAQFQKSEDRTRKVLYAIKLPDIGLKLVAGQAQ